jgi:hypothetical protein
VTPRQQWLAICTRLPPSLLRRPPTRTRSSPILEGLMHKSKLLLASLLALALTAPAARATIWQDNSFRYWWGPTFAEPGYGTYNTTGNPPFCPGPGCTVASNTDIYKSVFSFTHASGYTHGGNFLNVDVLYSSPKDPANLEGKSGSNQGAVELYVVYRHNISLNSFTTSKPFEVAFLRDVRIVGGADFETKNTTFAPEKLMPVLGAELSFAVPGFLNIGLVADKEFNNNGLQGAIGAVTFNVVPMITANWKIEIGHTPLTFEGFAEYNFPKGNDGFGNATVGELLLHPKVMFDVGELFDSKGYCIGVGWEYWLNKFGNDHTLVAGSLQSTAFVELAIHL